MLKASSTDAILSKLMKLGLTCSRDNYIRLAYLGEKTFDQLDAEEVAGLPELWDDDGNITQ
jgi:hypothetical protein